MSVVVPFLLPLLEVHSSVWVMNTDICVRLSIYLPEMDVLVPRYVLEPWGSGQASVICEGVKCKRVRKGYDGGGDE